MSKLFKYRCSGGNGDYYNDEIKAKNKSEAERILTIKYHSIISLIEIPTSEQSDVMTDKIRKKWLDEMPERIIGGDNSTYAEWLEKLVDTVLQDMHQYAFDEFHKHRKIYGTGKVVCIDGKDFNELLRLGKIKAKQLLNDE